MENQIFSRNMKIAALILVALGAILYLLAEVVIPVAISFLIAYFLDPLVDRFEERKISRTFAIAILTALSVLVLVAFLLVVIPLIETEITRFFERLPDKLSRIGSMLGPVLERWVGLDGPGLMGEINTQAMAWLKSLSASDMAPVSQFLSKAFSGTYAALSAIVSAVLVPIFTFYFLRDFDTLKMEPLELVPPRYREQVLFLAREVDDTLGSFIRGQGTVCLILAVLFALGYQLSGVPLGFLIGMVAGILAFIPYIGQGLGLVLSLLLALLDWQGYGTLVGIGITFAIVASLESFVLTPKIVGGKVGLSPVVVIIALMVGGELFGFAGVLVAVPTAAVLNILWRHGIEHYQKTAFFEGK